MSMEQAKAFIERMKTDEAFREKVLAIEDLAERIACIRGEGFECTEEEINEVATDGSSGNLTGGVDLNSIVSSKCFFVWWGDRCR